MTRWAGVLSLALLAGGLVSCDAIRLLEPKHQQTVGYLRASVERWDRSLCIQPNGQTCVGILAEDRTAKSRMVAPQHGVWLWQYTSDQGWCGEVYIPARQQWGYFASSDTINENQCFARVVYAVTHALEAS